MTPEKVYENLVAFLIGMEQANKYNFEQQANKLFMLFGIVIVMGVVIIINQIRLRKQLRQIQEQLSRAEAGGEDLT